MTGTGLHSSSDMPGLLFSDKIIPLQTTVVIKYFGQINIPVALRQHIKGPVHLTV